MVQQHNLNNTNKYAPSQPRKHLWMVYKHNLNNINKRAPTNPQKYQLIRTNTVPKKRKGYSPCCAPRCAKTACKRSKKQVNKQNKKPQVIEIIKAKQTILHMTTKNNHPRYWTTWTQTVTNQPNQPNQPLVSTEIQTGCHPGVWNRGKRRFDWSTWKYCILIGWYFSHEWFTIILTTEQKRWTIC